MTIATSSSFPFGELKVQGRNKSSSVALQKVALSGDVSGLFFSYKITQVYKNTTKKNLEIIYTFPIAWNTVLLGMEAVIGDVHRVGKVVEKKEAEEKYEEAVEKGDTAIMVEKAPHGLYTANLGNIKGGETVSVTIGCASLLSFEKGRVRLAIPTVIGERYGDPYAQGGLAPHESVAVDTLANYGFSLRIALHGAIAKSNVSCPSHDIVASAIDDGIQYEIVNAAFLDRDFILLCENIASHSLAQYIKKEDEYLMIASFAPSIPEAKESAIAVKILIDCSGSMSGERIEQAKSGLSAMLEHLSPADYVSYSRFGSTVVRDVKKALPADEATQGLLAKLIAQTDASLGGTELRNALSDTCSIPTPQNMPAQIFLITDGDVWNIDEILRTAKSSEHRIFAIGVGAAPSESLLREMAEQSGGACEFVSYEENMADAVVRMFNRMRGSIVRGVSVTWPEEPLWSSTPPTYLYDNETVHCFARFSHKPTGLPELRFCTESSDTAVTADILEEVSDENVFRLGKYYEMLETKDSKARTAIALAYQFVTENTSLLLIHERDTKLSGLPEVHNVHQMPAKGHGSFFLPCVGAALFCAAMPMASLSGALSSRAERCSPTASLADVPEDSEDTIDTSLENDSLQDLSGDDPLNCSFSIDTSLVTSLVDLWKATLPSKTTVEECVKQIRDNERFAAIWDFLAHMQRFLTVPVEDIFAILMQFLIDEGKAQCVDRHTKRILKARLSTLDKDLVKKAKTICAKYF